MLLLMAVGQVAAEVVMIAAGEVVMGAVLEVAAIRVLVLVVTE